MRYTHFGEGDYDETEQAIRALLAEARTARRLGGYARARSSGPTRGRRRPRPTSAAERAAGLRGRSARRGVRTLPALPGGPAAERFALGGRLAGDREAATAVTDATLDAHFVAQQGLPGAAARAAGARAGCGCCSTASAGGAGEP